MKRILLLAALWPSLALAEPPPTVELPTDLVVKLRQFLGTLPHDQVAALITGIETCVSVQVPQNGVIADHGQCPAVSKAIQDRAPKSVAPESSEKPH